MIQQDLIDFLDKIISTRRDENLITVIPLRCGLGKSSYLESLIQQRILSDNPNGMLIITDNIERLGKFLSSNQNRISMLTQENISEEIQIQGYKPILLMTTQRFFNLTKDEITSFLKYRDGLRTEIIFDEKPYLYEQIKITIESFNNIDTALQQFVDDTANQNEKEWCVQEWQKLRHHIQMQIVYYENLETERNHFYLYHKDSWDALTADDERFFRFLKSKKNALNRFHSDIYKNILAIQQLITDGAIFSCNKRSSGKYDNFFTILMDNTKNLLNVGAKVFVFDGTADISAMYDAECIDLVDCDEFKPSLDNLIINCVNISTSKNEICSSRSKSRTICDAIIRFIENHNYEETPVVFTYKEIEKNFSQYPTEHFGNIKGKNDYISSHNIIQVGLNRFPPLYYFLQRTILDDTELEMLKDWATSIEENIRIFTRALSLNSTVNPETKIPNFDIYGIEFDLLEDIEQNLFRSAIRDIRNEQKVNYTIFFNTTVYEDLIGVLNWRYGNLGATINIIDTPLELQILKTEERNTSRQTHAQRIITWIKQLPPDTEFKLKTMLDELGLTSKQFDKVKNSNSSIANLFKKMSTGKRGYYKR